MYPLILQRAIAPKKIVFHSAFRFSRRQGHIQSPRQLSNIKKFPTNKVKFRVKILSPFLFQAMKIRGWDGSEDLNKQKWTFPGSLFYSIVLISTIGYGDQTPKTQWGKVWLDKFIIS